MVTMNSNGLFTETPYCLEGPTCCGRLLGFEATFEHLVSHLGETDTLDDIEPEWVVRIDAPDHSVTEEVRIRNTGMGPRREPTEVYEWSVICHRDARWAAERIADALTNPTGSNPRQNKD